MTEGKEAARPGVTCWEYCSLPLRAAQGSGKRPGFFTRNELVRGIEDESEQAMAALGAAGWELVSVVMLDLGSFGTGATQLTAFFKRPTVS